MDAWSHLKVASPYKTLFFFCNLKNVRCDARRRGRLPREKKKKSDGNTRFHTDADEEAFFLRSFSVSSRGRIFSERVNSASSPVRYLMSSADYRLSGGRVCP